MSGGNRVIRQELPEEKSTKTTSRKNTTGTVLVRAEEMLNFVTEWMKHGSGDLIIDETLCERLTKYTKYRKELDKALEALLAQEYGRYMVHEDYVDTTSCAVVNFTTADNKVLLTAQVFADSSNAESYDDDDDDEYYDDDDDDDDESYDEKNTMDDPKLIRVRDFKRLLASLGNKMISYAYVGEETAYADLFLYCMDAGINFEVKNSKSGELKTIQLILPEDMEKQNEKSSSSNVQ